MPDNNNGVSVVGWIALVVAVIALILGWSAYNQASDDNLTGDINERAQPTANELWYDLQLQSARARVNLINTDNQETEEYLEDASEASAIQQSVRETFNDFDETISSREQVVLEALQTFEQNLRDENSSAAEQQKNRILDLLSAQIRLDQGR